ncbi:MAG TPA: hypothetical protein H9695_06160 [Candidatus Mediterraneibacter excrementigallinarum]|nr:hypothetical protein [Candidatus Mediterraneibacter excrementigallinarum]
MSRRTAKKRLKKINQVQAPAAETPVSTSVTENQESVPATAAANAQNAAAEIPAVSSVPEAKAPSYEMFLQYQNAEFRIENIAQRVLEKCTAEGMDSSELKIYVKPEDRKAYYACAGGSSYIDL